MILSPNNITFISLKKCLPALLSYPVLQRAKAEVLKSSCYVFGKSWAKHILVWSKLVPGLPDNRIHHIQACYLVFGFTLGGMAGDNTCQMHAHMARRMFENCIQTSLSNLFNELFNNLDHMFVELRNTKKV